MLAAWTWFVENLRAIGGCVTAIGACIGGYAAIDGPIPASVRYVDAREKYVLAENQKVERRVIDQQLQLNTVQRNLLRKEKFDREFEIQKDPNASGLHILKQRIDAIHDELDNIDNEREALRKEKAAK